MPGIIRKSAFASFTFEKCLTAPNGKPLVYNTVEPIPQYSISKSALKSIASWIAWSAPAKSSMWICGRIRNVNLVDMLYQFFVKVAKKYSIKQTILRHFQPNENLMSELIYLHYIARMV